jgi:hypothetical protein
VGVWGVECDDMAYSDDLWQEYNIGVCVVGI